MYNDDQNASIKPAIFPEPTARSAIPGVARGKGTNSARLFTPGIRKALAKFEVRTVVSSDLKNMVDYQE